MLLIVLVVAVVAIFVLYNQGSSISFGASDVTGNAVGEFAAVAKTSSIGWGDDFGTGVPEAPECDDPDQTYFGYDFSMSRTLFDADVELDERDWSIMTATVVTSNTGAHADVCENENTVLEWYCENGQAKSKYFWCGYNGLDNPYVCQSGACVPVLDRAVKVKTRR